MPTARRHCFFINNPPEGEGNGQAFIDSLDKSCIKYIVIQSERGHETGTHHFQGYVVWSNAIRVRQASRRLGGRASIIPSLGSDDECEQYCTKEDTRTGGPWRWGTLPRQGQRSDLEEVAQLVRAGASTRELLDAHFGTYLRYHRGIEIARSIYSVPQSVMPKTVVYWGPTETGKTRRAMEEAGPDAFIMMPRNGSLCWFDRYDAQENVVFDEFYGNMPWNMLLRVTDRYPLTLPVKGGWCNWKPKRIWITSNCHPRDWYNYGEKMHYLTLRRRFERVEHMAGEFLTGAIADVQ